MSKQDIQQGYEEVDRDEENRLTEEEAREQRKDTQQQMGHEERMTQLEQRLEEEDRYVFTGYHDSNEQKSWLVVGDVIDTQDIDSKTVKLIYRVGYYTEDEIDWENTEATERAIKKMKQIEQFTQYVVTLEI